MQLIDNMFIPIKTPVFPLFFRDNYHWPFLPASDVKVKKDPFNIITSCRTNYNADNQFSPQHI